MANTGLYAPYKKANVDILGPGLLKAWISLKSDFTTLNEPVIPVSPVLGDAYTITTTHAWATGQEAIPIFVDADTLEAPAESNGAPRSQRLVHRPKIFIIGDGANILEMVNNWLNEELIIFVQDQCDPAKYIQYGCDCYPAVVEKQAFATGTLLGSNAKGYEMTVRALCKYFYTGDIDERTA
jgi:hypothetical protein